MSRRRVVRRCAAAAGYALTTMTICCVAIVLTGLAVGYRPVVLETGSMGDTAPAGSLVIARPVAVESIARGDIVVMQRPDALPITHRVIEVDETEVGLVATTKGDGNNFADAAPYALADDELVVRWIVPSLGATLKSLRDPRVAVALLGFIMMAVTGVVLQRIWANHPSNSTRPTTPSTELLAMPDEQRRAPASAPPPPPPPPVLPGSTPDDEVRTRPVTVALGVFVVAALTCAGVVWGLYSSTASVPANAFTTADCFGARLAGVQSGETVHSTDGVVSEPITAVVETRAFVMASVRSAANEPADSTAQVSLAAGGASIEIRRSTDNPSPNPVTVAWSVVEYECGITVQRGTVNGDGTARLDIPITAVDTTTSFVLSSSAPQDTAASFGTDDLVVTELSSPTTLTIRGDAGAAFSASRSFAWQVVTFDDSADATVQTVAGTLGVGTTTDSLTLASPVDPATTFVIAGSTSATSGTDIGERLVRAHLVDANTVEISRGVGTDTLDVQIQVISLHDGSTVRHGTVDFSPGQSVRNVTFDPVDPDRSTAISTVATPGLSAGGRTDHVADDVVGEASATFDLVDGANVAVTRDATASNASFGWQVIEWSGPGWWDTNYLFRQRIDVATSTASAPGEYTVGFDVNHASLVASGIALANGDDLRVLRWDGTTWTELDRILDDGDTWNATNTTVRFRTTDAIAAGRSSTYWMYTANPAASAPPNDPENVFLLVEDFETGDLGDFEDRTGGTNWYQADPWTRRIVVTIPAGRVASDLTDFPVLVSLTDADLAAAAQSDGSDIRFTAADGTTALPHEIESFDNGTGAVNAWVRVPTVAAASATSIHMYYGAGDAPDQEEIRNTWASEFEAVWHLARDPAGTAPQLDDSTQRNHDGLSIGAMAGIDRVAGRVGAALDLDGTDDGLQPDLIGLSQKTALTISGWVRLDTLAADATLFSKADDATNRQVDLTVLTDGSVRARLLLDSGEAETTTPAAAVTTGTWHHVAMTWNSTDIVVIIDGTARSSSSTSGAIDARPQMPVVLGNIATQARGIDGVIDEVRLETVARSADWLAAATANQNDPATFLVVGAPEVGTWFAQAAWSFRKPITVDSDLVPTDVFDFALLVQMTEPRIQAAAQACACDLVFTGADGTTRLDHVIETYDSGTGALTAWVSVPVLSSAEDTKLFVYYGNPTATDQQDPAAVFGPDADLQQLGAP